MPLKLLRNDITKMQCDAIVNTSNKQPIEEEELRAYYQKNLQLAYENKAKSIAFPLISTGGLEYPKEEGMRIAVDEINAFLLEHQMLIYLVVDDKTSKSGKNICPGLASYIAHNYVYEEEQEERRKYHDIHRNIGPTPDSFCIGSPVPPSMSYSPVSAKSVSISETNFDFYEQHESKLQERMEHMTDTFSEYLLYLIEDKGMTNAEVYKRAIVSKKVFSKIKNNPDYHPKRVTAMCLCVGARLNLDETKDLLARAGYALSPCDKTDVIFSYFIENRIYDMIELDIQLEAWGQKCLIT